MHSNGHPNLAIVPRPPISPHRTDKPRTVTATGQPPTVAEIRAAVVYGITQAERHSRAVEFAGDARYHIGGADHLTAVLAFIDGPAGVIG